jgi:hypothetical protein
MDASGEAQMSAAKMTQKGGRASAEPGEAPVGVPEGDITLWDEGALGSMSAEHADELASLVDPHDHRRRRKIAELRAKWLRVLAEHARGELDKELSSTERDDGAVG